MQDFTAGAGTTPPTAEVIRGGMKRPRAMPVLGGASTEAKPMLPVLGFAAWGVAKVARRRECEASAQACSA